MGAFATGFETGLRQSEAGQQEKQAREDLLFQTKVQDLASTRNALQAKYAATLDKEGKPTEATQGILDQLQQNAGDIRELFHPDKNPGAIERFGHLLTDALHITKPAPKITTEVGAITIPGSPASAPQPSASGMNAQGASTPPPGAGGPSIAESSQAISLPGQKVTVTEVPQKQYDKQQALQARNLAADREAAQQAAAGAPIGPLQEAILQADADTTKWLSLYHAKVDELRKADPGMSQEDAQRSALELMGVRLTSSLKPPMMLKLADGTETMAQQDPNGVWRYPDQEEIPLDLLKGAQMMPKPGATPHTILNQEQDAYAKSYGFSDFSQLPPALQSDAQLFVQQRAKLNTEFGHATRSTTTKPDATGQLRAVTVWNYTTPFGVKPLEDPLSGLYKFGANKPTLIGQGTPQSPTTPTKKEPAVPRKQAHGEPSQQGNVQISAPLGMQMQTSVLTKAANDYTAAEKIDQMAKRTLAAPDNTVQQRNLALSLIKAMAGRVQMTEYNLYTTKMGVPNTVEGLINGIMKSGQLPENIVKNLADTAASDLYAARYVLQNTPGGQDWLSAQGSTVASDYSAQINESNKAAFPGAPPIGTMEQGDDGKQHKYIGGDPGEEKNWPVVTK